MAILTVQKPVAAGSVLALVAAGATGDEWIATNNSAMFVVDNASAGVVTVTFKCFVACNTGGIFHDSVQTVAAGAREFFPPGSGAFADPATGRAKATCSPTTSVTVGVVSPT